VTFLIRFLTIVLLVVLVAWVLWLVNRVRFWMDFLTGRRARPARQSPERQQVALHRDPVCGTFVSPEISFTLEHAGQTHHFCSAECRAQFQSKLPRAANG
jgi:YHS domain-containing protein